MKPSARTNEVLGDRHGRGRGPVPGRRASLPARRPLSGAPTSRGRSTTRRPSRLPVVLTGTSDRRPHLHRLRRHLDAVRGGREPAAQHPARHGLHLPRDRHPGGPRGLRGAARVGRLERASPTSTRPSSHVARKAGGTVALRDRERDAAGGQHGLGHGRAARRGAAALRHGPQRRPAARVLRRHRAEARHPAQQRAAGGRLRARSAASCSATSSAPRC